MRVLPYLFIISSAILWGIISIFVSNLSDGGYNPIQIVTIRVAFAAIILTVFTALKDAKLLKIDFKDFYYFIGTGIISIVFFNWCYFTSLKLTSVSISAVLLYTAPAFVTIFSRIIFKESISKMKIFSLVLTFMGCMLVTGFLENIDTKISLLGLFIGLGSGLGYALYSIFSKLALKKYNPITITLYTFVFAAIGLIPLGGYSNITNIIFDKKLLLNSLELGVFSTVIAYYLYTYGLSYIESTKAAIIATIEPVVASLIGIFYFRETLSMLQIVGIVFVVGAVVMISMKQDKAVIVSENENDVAISTVDNF
jgi:drug/metabolite transporter (DMT)-like permease